MPAHVIVGLQRGDEGKGRFIDMRAADYDVVARFNGGRNAGHTVVLTSGQKIALHQVPSGITHEHTVNVIGNGTLFDPTGLKEEVADLRDKGIKVSSENLRISSAAHLVLPHHIFEDQIREAGSGSQGSTKAGIAQTASDKAMRIGPQVENIVTDPGLVETRVREGLQAQRAAREAAGIESVDEDKITSEYMAAALEFKDYIIDTVLYLNQMLRRDKPARLLAEGAQAFLLDIDHGMYPYTTSTSTTAGGASTGLGIPPYFIERVMGIVKTVQSHVGGGPFVTEVQDQQILASLHGDQTAIDAERGATTGRVRRLGFLDLPQIRRANIVNGTHEIALSKLDWVPRYGDKIPVCVSYTLENETHLVAPSSTAQLERAIPNYEYLPAWKEDIQDVRDFNKLPKEAQDYILFVEEKLGVPISMIGTGPRRDQVIVR
jgi:adenylosuccinate synthase